MTVVSSRLSPGGTFARLAMAMAGGKGIMGAQKIAEHDFRDSPDVGMFLKSADIGALTADGAWANSPPGSIEFLTMLAAQTAVGKFGSNGIPSLRKVPFHTLVPVQLGSAAAYWVGEGKAKPLSSASFDGLRLPGRTVCAIIPLTGELVAARGRSAEMAVQAILTAAVSAELNSAFLDPNVAEEADVSPASITNGVSPIGSSGDPTTDIAALVAAATLDLSDAVLIMSPVTASQIALRLGAGAAGLTVRGGTLGGMPTITSTGIGNNIALVHAGSILLADDGELVINVARETSLEMSEAPTMDSTTPTPTTMVSLFQSNSEAVRVERRICWSRAVDEAVLLVSGVDYSIGS